MHKESIGREVFMIASIIVPIVVVIVAIWLIANSVYIVPQQMTYIVERLGKYHIASDAGIHVRIPLIDRIAAKIDMRVLQLESNIKTKTKDDTFVTLAVAVQYRVDKGRVYEAFYELSDPEAQIESYIEDVVRNSVPGITLDDTFSQKDTIARDVKNILDEKMSKYGYTIISTLITDVRPAEAVMDAMNSINEAQRRRQAATELGEADKVIVVKKAEAQRDKMKLQGEGVAAQRKAIIDGLMAQVKEMAATGMSSEQIMSIIMANQYIDTLNGFASSPNAKTLFLSSDASAMNGVQAQILSALEATSGGSVPDIAAIDKLLAEQQETFGGFDPIADSE